MAGGTPSNSMWVLIGDEDGDTPKYGSPEGQATDVKKDAALFYTEIEVADFRDAHKKLQSYISIKYYTC